jgi:hypothetical protein
MGAVRPESVPQASYQRSSLRVALVCHRHHLAGHQGHIYDALGRQFILTRVAVEEDGWPQRLSDLPDGGEFDAIRWRVKSQKLRHRCGCPRPTRLTGVRHRRRPTGNRRLRGSVPGAAGDAGPPRPVFGRGTPVSVSGKRATASAPNIPRARRSSRWRDNAASREVAKPQERS